MGFFSRKRADTPPDLPTEPSLAEIEENPELLAAEAAVNTLPAPPPSETSWIQGSTTGMVTFPGPGPDDEPPEESLEEPPEA
jgi:hypothetical protein